MIREQRFQRTEIRMQASPRADSIARITGYAAKFGTKSEDLGGFRETIARGAFDKSLASNPDVRFLRDHNASYILGRTRSGTLQLSTDNVGLRFACDLPDTSQGRDLKTSIQRGDVNQCSFAFSVDDEDWSDDDDDDDDDDSDDVGDDVLALKPARGPKHGKRALRTLRAVKLIDCSAVTYPAYSDTEVHVDPVVAAMGRSLWPGEIPLEVRSHVPGITQRSVTTPVDRRRSLVNRVLGI